MQKGSLVAAVKEITSRYSPSRVTVSPYGKHWSVGDLICHMFCGMCYSRKAQKGVFIL